MGMNKLNDYEARCIGEAIAKKAMEHLIGPLDNEIDYFVRTCYEQLLVNLGITGREVDFLDAGMIDEVQSATVKFATQAVDGRDYPFTVISSNGAKLLLGRAYGAWQINDPALADEYVRLTAERAPFLVKRQSMAYELKQQMLNKSAKYIMKTWPEAAQFVADQFNIDIATGKDVSMTTPLSELLAKYMPMLSAPQPEMEGA